MNALRLTRPPLEGKQRFEHRSQGRHHAPHGHSLQELGSRAQPKKQKKANKERREDRRVRNAEGNYTHTTQGKEICFKFNQGGCEAKCPAGRAHQCSKCLQNNHGAASCGTVKGKGKGKKGKGSHAEAPPAPTA